MTVAQLIDKLRTFPPETLVFTYQYSEGQPTEPEPIMYDQGVYL